jgi:predicted nuclease with TOPRIM domain
MSPTSVAFVTPCMTPQISIRFDDERLAEIEELAEREGVTRSEYIRDSLDARQKLDDLETENERLRRQLTAINQRVDEHQDLVEYVQEERSLAQEQRERRNAPMWTRAKWYVFGRSDEGGDG